MKLGTALLILAVAASALTAMFIIHSESDSSLAEVSDAGQCGPHAYYRYWSDNVLVIDGYGEMYDYSSEPAPWHDCCKEIKKLVIGDSITYLGAGAFENCTNLRELTLPISVSTVNYVDGHRPFTGCHNLEKVTFTAGTGNAFDYDDCGGSSAWYELTPWHESKGVIKEIVISDGIRYIGMNSFRELSVDALVIPDSVCSLGDHCFAWSEITTLTIPVSLNPYGNRNHPAFEGCASLNKVIFTRGNGVPFDYSFYSLSPDVSLAPWNAFPEVTKTIIISEDVTTLGKFTFTTCNIESITIPISINLKYGAFEGGLPHDSLKYVIITKGTTGIGWDYNSYTTEFTPWYTAKNIESIIFEEGVTHIGQMAFIEINADLVVFPNSMASLDAWSFNLSSIKHLVIPISLNAAGIDKPVLRKVTGIETVTFTVGNGHGCDYGAYERDDAWYQFTPWYQSRSTLKEIIFEDGIKHIGADAFRELNLTSLVIPDSVESLGCHTFYKCARLTDVTVPISLDCACSAKYSAFEGCTSITTLRFTAGTGIGVDYTADCHPAWCNPGYNVTQISLDSGITYIGTHAFDQFLFTGKDGKLLQYTAADLSGHVFTRNGALMCLTDSLCDGSSAGSVVLIPAASKENSVSVPVCPVRNVLLAA